MKTFSNTSRIIAAAALASAALGAATAAQARTDVVFSIGLPFPAVYTQPAPVYVQPQPVYSQPRPVYVEPQPVYVQRAEPVIEYRYASGPGWRHEWERREWERRQWMEHQRFEHEHRYYGR